jgi:predicted RNA-binding protein with RPS1 domain
MSLLDEFGREIPAASLSKINNRQEILDKEAQLREKLKRRREQRSGADQSSHGDDGNCRRNRDSDLPNRRHYGGDSHHRERQPSDNRRYNKNHDDHHHHHHEDKNHPTPFMVEAGQVYPGRVVRIESYGAFVELQMPEQQRIQPLVGLVHISQIVHGHRLDRVEEVVQLNQAVHVLVLDVEAQQGRGAPRIRLRMAGVDQETGQVDSNQQLQQPRGDGWHASARDRRGTAFQPMPMEQRARHRQELMRQVACTWKDDAQSLDIPYLRQLWSSSPEPPSAVAPTATTKATAVLKRKHADSESSSSGSESSSEESRRRSRSKSSRRRKKSSSRRSSRKSSRRRKYSSSSSSSDSSSASSSSSSVDSTHPGKSKPRNKSEDSVSRKETESTTTTIPAVSKEAQDFKAAVQGRNESSSDEDDGPQPLPRSNAALNADNTAVATATYGKALLAGEGQAIAQFVQQNLRVPRRGEIGVSQDAIEKYERSGYVMSGSRHAKMNAVRLRKENQVYSAEEQRALALITMEENQQKEAALMEDFRSKLKEKQAAREARK